MLTAFTILALACFATGMYLIAAGYRRFASLTCAVCGYDLRGRTETERCPECGTHLDGTSIRTPGETKTIVWKVALGALLVFPSLVVLWTLMLVWIVRHG